MLSASMVVQARTYLGQASMTASEPWTYPDLLTDGTENVFTYGGQNTSLDSIFDVTGGLGTGTYAPSPNLNGTVGGRPPIQLDLSAKVRISLYTLIFILAVVGNTLIIVTLVQNRRMRTVTYVFLINLSVSDLLLAIVCMPFTLIPTLQQNFIFGKVMCVLIRYLQGVSVAVSAFTLVSISLERYFAICQPLRSRSWQTLSHSYKMILAVWIISLIVMIPTAVTQRLLNMKWGGHKCGEIWQNKTLLEAYTLFLDAVLLVGPLLLMLVAYGRIAHTLCKGMNLEERSAQEMRELRSNPQPADDDMESEEEARYNNGVTINGNRRSTSTSRRRYDTGRPIRQTNTERSLRAKRRVIRMLFVVVVEFFICWTPVYVLQTWITLDHDHAKRHVTAMEMNMVHLLSYVSSCCNPITYCFMNKRFRQGFIAAFDCCGMRRRRHPWQEASSFAASQRTGKSGRLPQFPTPQTNKKKTGTGSLRAAYDEKCTDAIVNTDLTKYMRSKRTLRGQNETVSNNNSSKRT